MAYFEQTGGAIMILGGGRVASMLGTHTVNMYKCNSVCVPLFRSFFTGLQFLIEYNKKGGKRKTKSSICL